jgi:hypothetical protein
MRNRNQDEVAGKFGRIGNLVCSPHVANGGRIGDCIVKKVQEYLEHASECRTLARTAPPAHREQLEEMARTWEQLAEARRGKIKKQLKTQSARHPSAI